MMKKLIVTAVLAFALGWIACSLLTTKTRSNQVSMVYPKIEEYEIKSYPHIDSQILKRINMTYHQLKIGMSKSEVYSLIGKPQEVRYLYELPKITNTKKIGYTWWYVAQRMKATGSVNDKDEKLLRIAFNFEDIVIAIDPWGFDPQNEAEQVMPPNGP